MRAAAKQVQVEMIDGLAAVLACVDHNSIALAKLLQTGNLCCGPQQVTEQGLLVFTHLIERADVFARHDQHVHRRFRADVGKGISKVVLIDRGRRNLSCDDLAEEAIHSLFSVHGA